jgi:hypothetical protein
MTRNRFLRGPPKGPLQRRAVVSEALKLPFQDRFCNYLNLFYSNRHYRTRPRPFPTKIPRSAAFLDEFYKMGITAGSNSFLTATVIEGLLNIIAVKVRHISRPQQLDLSNLVTISTSNIGLLKRNKRLLCIWLHECRSGLPLTGQLDTNNVAPPICYFPFPVAKKKSTLRRVLL